MRAIFDLISVAQVYAVHPTRHTITIMDITGQIFDTETYVGNSGAADAIRINQEELPSIGTWGLVAFPFGDNRNSIWVCSIPIGPIDAVNCDPSNPDPYLRYLSHYSGFFRTLDREGNMCSYFPDGTYVKVGSDTSVPTTYHNVVNGQTKAVLPLLPTDRITTVPAPFNAYISHPSGTTVGIDPSGNTTINIASGAEYQVVSGSNTIKIDSSGNVTIIGTSVTIQDSAGSTALLDGTGNIKMTATSLMDIIASTINLEAPVNLGSGSSGGTMSASGPISLSVPSGDTISIGGSQALVLATAFYNWAVNHVHTNGNGGANTGTATSDPTGYATTTLLGS